MTGRNNKPDNDGPASQPGRLDQFGDKLADSRSTATEQAAQSRKDKQSDKR